MDRYVMDQLDHYHLSIKITLIEMNEILGNLMVLKVVTFPTCSPVIKLKTRLHFHNQTTTTTTTT
jgi:hypothetical protein